MQAAGCRAVALSDELAVMGLAEVVAHLPRLLRLRRRLAKRWLTDPPDLFIGIDAPEFNLALEKKLHRRGVPTAHYVSPSVWAWRSGRIKTIARAVDLMLTLFPFEADFYLKHNVRASCVGHPLADVIPPNTEAAPLRAALRLSPGAPLVALLPGSRAGEVSRLAGPFAATVHWLRQRLPGVQFAAAMATPSIRDLFERALHASDAHPYVHLIDGRAREVMGASDVVLLASGTASLEALFLGRPMVVAYRVAPLSAWLARRLGLIKVNHFSLPNLLSMQNGGPVLVDEFIQENVRAERMGQSLYELLTSPQRRERQLRAFRTLHEELRRDTGHRAADAVSGLLRERIA